MANFISYTGLFFSSIGIIMVSTDWKVSVLFLMAAGICDLFDGVVARKFNSQENPIGKQLDSLIDVVSFSVLPVTIVISLDDNVLVNIIIFFIYVGCAIWRLAVFNTIPPDKDCFVGVPVTLSSLILPVSLLLYFVINPEVSVWIVRITMIILSLLFVSRIKYKKPKGISYVIYSIAGLLLMFIWLGILIF